jgi:hypothetical protein
MCQRRSERGGGVIPCPWRSDEAEKAGVKARIPRLRSSPQRAKMIFQDTLAKLFCRKNLARAKLVPVPKPGFEKMLILFITAIFLFL